MKRSSVDRVNAKEDVLPFIRDLSSAVKACSDSLLLQINGSLVNAEFLAQIIVDEARHSEKETEVRDSFAIDNVIEICKQLAGAKKVNINDMSSCLAKLSDSLPLQVLVKLITAGMFRWEDYIGIDTDFREGSRLFSLSCELQKKCHEGRDISSTEVIYVIRSLSYFLKDAPKKVSESINEIIYDTFEEHDFSLLFIGSEKEFLLPKLVDSMMCQHGFNSTLIVNLFNGFIQNGGQQSIQQAFRHHRKWTFDHLKENTVEVLQSLFINLDNETLSMIISSSLRSCRCNFQRLFAVVSVWIASTDDAVKIIADVSRQLLKDCLDIENFPSAKLSLLLARHCSLEYSPRFYEKWLQDALCSLGPVFSSDRKTLSNFIKCLLDLVPVESKNFLSVHLSVLPQVSSTAKNLLNEYVAVAKTMMQDLNVQERPSSFSSNNAATEAARADVNRGLDHFRSTGAVPKTIMEISVFRKPYFVGSFLPVLLNPEAAKNDASRQACIEQLNNAGKIPSKVYQRYCQAVEDEKISKRFAEAGYDLHQAVELVTGKINELTQIAGKVFKIQDEKKQRLALRIYLCSLSTHLAKFKEVNDKCKDSNVRREHRYKEVIRVFLDSLCRAYSINIEVKKSGIVAVKSFIKPVIKTFQTNCDFMRGIKASMLELLEADAESLESCHIQAFAGLITSFEDTNVNQEKPASSLSQFVFRLLNGSRRCFNRFLQGVELLSYSLLLCHENFPEVVVVKDDIIGDISAGDGAVIVETRIINWWLTMCCKMKASLTVANENKGLVSRGTIIKMTELLAFADAVKQLTSYKEIVKSFEMSATEWVHLELGMDDSRDLLPPYLKEDYFYRVIHLNRRTVGAGNDWSYTDVATALVSCMLGDDSVCKCHFSPACGNRSHVSVGYYGDDSSSVAKNIIERSSTSIVNAISSHSGHHVNHRLSNSLLFLLRSLNRSIGQEQHPCENDLFSENESWLFKAVDRWITGRGTGDRKPLTSMNELNTLCCVLDSLPPDLLFGSWISENEANIDSAVSLVNKLASAFLNGKIYLPCSLTWRILNALTSSNDDAKKDSTKLNGNIQCFLSACPIFVVSLVRHGSSPLITGCLQVHAEYGLNCFQSIMRLISHLLNSDYKRATLVALSSTVVALSVYTYWSEKTDAREATLAIILKLGDDILVKILECMVLDVMFGIIHGQERNHCKANTLLAIRLIKMIPNRSIQLFDEFLQGRRDLGLGGLRTLLVTRQFILLFPVAIVKILAAMDPLYRQRFSSLENAFAVLVCCIEKCNALVSGSGIEDLAGETDGGAEHIHISPFDLKFLNELSIVERCIRIRT